MFWVNDFPSLLLGSLAAAVCGLWGNFLILRRQSLLGDAISHVVLPGIVVGFLVVGGAATATALQFATLIGALLAALAAVALIELIRRTGLIESGAAMGVVFTAMFAAGVLLLEQTDASKVHIDVEHALMGGLERVVWTAALSGPGSLAALADAPAEIWRIALVYLFSAILVVVFLKELRMVSFDPAFAEASGVPARWVGFAIAAMTALAAVAAFDAVGSILVIAMFVCPAATARVLTDRLARQIWLSQLVAIIGAVGGYMLAAFAAPALGLERGVSAAAMIAVTAGLIQAVAMIATAKRRQ
ncbi:MAG: metal ABC transporter permease [Neomegalonema sp.]|nr:metal ABC transporter permease [Neomegalonema sp.]